MEKVDLLPLFKRAQNHLITHRCSAKPYELGQELFDLVEKYNPQNILEIGTGIGYATAVLALAAPQSNIQTIERNPEHVQAAKEYLAANGILKNIQIIEGIAEEVLPRLSAGYDFIFFDAFGIHYEFLPQYHRLLIPGGLVVIANNHLLSKTSDRFFAELNDPVLWKIMDKYEDTTVAQRL